MTELQLRDSVAVIRMSGSAAGFDATQRLHLARALDLALAEPGLRAIVITGRWPFALDPSGDYAAAPDAPLLATLADRIAQASVPVIALLSGRIGAGALALAQAARLRIALPDARFAPRERALGLIPAAGGLVRLVRRVGAGAALGFLSSGRVILASDALGMGLCDAVLSENAVDPVALARGVVEGGLPLGRAAEAGLADPAAGFAAIAAARAAIAPGALALVAQRCADCAEAALMLPLAAALDYEQVAYSDLLDSPQSQGLRHVALARHRALGLAGVAMKASAPARIALWGQPDSLALALIGAGHHVTLGGAEPEQLQRAFSRIAVAQDAAVQAGALEPARRDADWARLAAAADAEGLVADGPEIVIATLTGPVAARAETLAQLRAVLASGTLLVVEGAPPARGEVGLRRTGPLCEVTPGPETGDAALAVAQAVLSAAGGVILRGGPGAGIVARLRAALLAAAERAVLAGAAPAEVDRAMVAFGFAEGPLLQVDRAGPGHLAAAIRRGGRAPGALAIFLAQDSQPLYARTDGAVVPALRLNPLLEAIRQEAGIAPRALSAAQIQARLLAELAGEGAAMLQGGGALRASDIDLAAVVALHFPEAAGGPLFQADRMGLLKARTLLRELAEDDAPAPVTLWDVLIRNGRKFADLNG